MASHLQRFKAKESFQSINQYDTTEDIATLNNWVAREIRKREGRNLDSAIDGLRDALRGVKKVVQSHTRDGDGSLSIDYQSLASSRRPYDIPLFSEFQDDGEKPGSKTTGGLFLFRQPAEIVVDLCSDSRSDRPLQGFEAITSFGIVYNLALCYHLSALEDDLSSRFRTQDLNGTTTIPPKRQRLLQRAIALYKQAETILSALLSDNVGRTCLPRRFFCHALLVVYNNLGHASVSTLDFESSKSFFTKVLHTIQFCEETLRGHNNSSLQGQGTGDCNYSQFRKNAFCVLSCDQLVRVSTAPAA